jgi:hypothetical protein
MLGPTAERLAEGSWTVPSSNYVPPYNFDPPGIHSWPTYDWLGVRHGGFIRFPEYGSVSYDLSAGVESEVTIDAPRWHIAYTNPHAAIRESLPNGQERLVVFLDSRVGAGFQFGLTGNTDSGLSSPGQYYGTESATR